MNTVIVDFETAYSKDYSLRKMPPVLYVRDPRFKILGAGVLVNGEYPQWLTDMGALRELINNLRPVNMCGHNLLFDALILVERLGITRDGVKWLDTLSLARGSTVSESYSLEALSRGSNACKTEMPDIVGKWELNSAENTALAEYCKADVLATLGLLTKFLPNYPQTELDLIDLTVEMGVRARLVLNKDMLKQAMEAAITERAKIIHDSGLDPKILSSNPQFAKYLGEMGLSPPLKISVTTGKETTAFAKNDLAFVEFQKENPQLANVFAAREAVKSTLGITRAKSFIAIAESGKLPVPLVYWGAHSGRWSGGAGLNLQNLPRGSELRKSIEAPDGFVLVVGDLGQIEARVLAMLAGQQSMIDIFRAGTDLYTEFAKIHYGKAHITKAERQFGKTMCIAEGELVLTNEGLIPVESVTTAQKVWDGVEWVNHDGVIFQGTKEVMTYDGLTATADHRVFTQCSDAPTPLWQAASEMARLDRTEAGGLPVGRLGDSQGTSAEQRSEGEPLQISRRETRVYDIVNAGPRHRFTVSGVLVRNCLALGYSMGATKFADNIRKGFMGAAPIAITDDEAVHTVQRYRTLNSDIAAYWREAQEVGIGGMRDLGYGDSQDWGIFKIENSAIVLPNGMRLKYPSFWYDEAGASFWNGKNSERLYGGKLVNHLCQSTARIILSDGWRKIAEDYPVVLSVHDELVIMVPEAETEAACEKLRIAMTTPPAWMPDIPLTADIQWAKNYSK